MNLVQKLSKLTYEEKVRIKAGGRPTPDLQMDEKGVSRGKTFVRRFNRDIYNKNRWICGCDKLNALFCFPCLLFGGETSWTVKGVTNLSHLPDKIKKHDRSKPHLFNETELALLGQLDVRTQLHSAYYLNIRRQNEEVTRNRYILSKIINCVKFCGLFELALRGHDDMADFENAGIFRGLINFTAELDKTFDEHLKNDNVFRGTSKDMQNDLLDCMLMVCQRRIIKEVQEAEFLAVMTDETANVSDTFQMVNILRYVKNGNPIERFWNFLLPQSYDAGTIAEKLLRVIDTLLLNVEEKQQKLIAQCFDGAAVVSGARGSVQAKIKESYPFAHFIHCYAHQLNVIMAQAASQNTEARSFFSNVQMIPAFFSGSPQRSAVLEKVVDSKIPWNFKFGTVNLVYEHRKALIECMENIEDDASCSNSTVINQCTAIKRMLQDRTFVFWLTFFRHIMPHVEALHTQLQEGTLDAFHMNIAVKNFVERIDDVRSNIFSIITEAEASSDNLEPPNKRIKSEYPENRETAALDICDVIISNAKDRFSFSGHLSASLLFVKECFEGYAATFPENLLNLTTEAYPMLDKAHLTTELSVIYMRSEFREARGATALLNFLIRNNLEETFKETKRCLEIIITTPMVTSEAERCFSTLKRVKTFLRNTMGEDRLNALAMISIQHDLLEEIPDFNEQVIDELAQRKEHRVSLTFKK